MRLPRRVPWTSLAELEHLFFFVYADENDIESKILAINRISAWRNITSLPHALESTLALLVVIVHDKKQAFFSTLHLRQSYAIAILRLVNGLVDPLQVGTYARSITSIAQQLGIPSWLVELRHASTHEDLPSLDLLREAARQSMSWLLHNYFLPTINPVSNGQQVPNSVRLLAPMLNLYKNTMKIITRDASLMLPYKLKVVNVLRDLERWIAETKVGANIFPVEIDWASHQSSEAGTDVKEIWALERFCDGLAETGMLVPLSKRKRRYSDGSLLPSKSSIALWNPLLKQVQANHPEFPYVICLRFSLILLGSGSPKQISEAITSDPSYEGYLACWIYWVIETCRDNKRVYLDLKRCILLTLMKGLGCDSQSLSGHSSILPLLKKLCAGQEEIETMMSQLTNSHSRSGETWDSNDLDIMKERNEMLKLYELTTTNTMVLTSPSAATHEISVPGWSLLENGDWNCCPLGVYQL